MISVSGKNWAQKIYNKNLIQKIKQDNNFSEILSKLIISRKFDENEIYSIENNLDIPNIFEKNDDYIKSAALLIDVINKKEKICILGDYDVDGSAATALLVKFFESLNQPYFYYIPDRIRDGYGASKKLFAKLILRKPKLVIMVDCGSNSIDAVDFLNKNNIKSLIIDHHEISKPYPNSNAIINPKKNNGYLEYDYLCATTLTFFFLKILSKKIKCKINISDYSIYVVLATVCDVMPMRKLNRLIAIDVLKKFDVSKNYAFNLLFKLNNKNNKINIDDLGFLIGPILNAGGRLGKSNYATQLLSSNNITIIKDLAIDLNNLNQKRKKIETLILNKIDFNKIEKDNKEIIILYAPNINEGLIGIIAARLKDYFNRPSIVITNSNDILKGSARSIDNYNIGLAIKIARDQKILINGGGHAMAAGFTLKNNNIKKLEKFLLKDFIKKNNLIVNRSIYDDEILPTAFNKEFFKEIKKLEPFGNENPLPTFLFKDLKIIKSTILKDKHVSSILKSKIGFSIKSISFNSVNTNVGDYLLNYKKNLNVLGQISENFWNNKNTLQLTVRDLIL